MTRFFLSRPVFAAVASIVVLIMGLVAIPSLPIAQFPQVAPPEVTVTATYIGANAAAVESAVTMPLEEAINGIEGLRHISSISGNNGISQITVQFNLGRSPDLAQSDVQNAVLSATGRLPQAVQQTGVVVKKSSPAFVLGVGLLSDGHTDKAQLSDYVEHHVVNDIKRIKGVGDVRVFGIRRYAMRVWLDPQKLQAQGLTAGDVVSALQSQNQLVAAGAIGAPPTTGKQVDQIQLNVDGRLSDVGEFERIIVKRTGTGGYVRLADVGRVELGAEDYSSAAKWNGQDCIGFGVVQTPDANALDTALAVRATMERLKSTFPTGVSYVIPFDATLFVRESIKEVITTLLIAILLVVLVIYVFLQDWKMTLVPVITIPVSLIGTFALMKALNFSINTLTLFGLTLATGLVVDDAIVVIENIARFVQEKKIAPFAAAEGAMKEISGAVVATSLVLLAVFIPVGFFPGSTGVLYKQFAITIACSIAISLFTALTLAPPLTAILLKGEHESNAPFFRMMNRGINGLRRRYHAVLPKLFRVQPLMLGLFAGALVFTGLLYTRTPTAFLPAEDQGYLIEIMQTPTGTSADFQAKVADRISAKLKAAIPEAEGIFQINGFGFAGAAPNRGLAFIPLKPWDERAGAGHDAATIAGRGSGIVFMDPEALGAVFPPPAVQGIGNTGGFQLLLLDNDNLGFDAFTGATYGFIGALTQDPQKRFSRPLTLFGNNLPEINVTVDREQSENLGIPFASVAQTLGVFEGSQYVNDFNYKNRSYRVYAQADAPFRSSVAGLNSMYVRSPEGGLTPLSSLVKIETTKGPTEINHYNLVRSIEIDGDQAPGVSSGQIIQAVDQISKKTLPAGVSYEWYGLMRDQIEGGSLAAMVFALGIVFVFLVLAAQYENFWDPFIILLSVPLALLGALLAIGMRGFPSDVFVQVGFVMLIGLASKNAILIVEFANQLQDEGMKPLEAVARAAETRLRPIIMTSLAFMFGILPLAVATGAGSGARNSLGTAVLGGMLVSTVLNLIFVPVVYVAVDALRRRLGGGRKPKTHGGLAAVVGWLPVKRESRTEWLPVYPEKNDDAPPSV